MQQIIKARQLIVFLMIGFTLTGSVACNKSIQQQYDDILKKLMVDGSWTVTKFMEDGNDITASFNGWICKFHDDNTMTATQGVAASATVESGTWQSNLSAQTISAQFQNSVGAPLNKINGVWMITNTSATSGTFSQTKNGSSYIMELTKY